MVAGPLNGAAAAVDWTAPWYEAVAAHGRARAGPDWRAGLNEEAERLGLRTSKGLALRFVDANAAGHEPYEAFIARTGRVPSRDNLHDFINAMVWMAMPRTKARLNALQASALAEHGVREQRGALRDAATLIDENGVLLVTTRADLIEALRAHDWAALFVAARAAWPAEIRAVACGHALMEKLTRPYKAITAHALPVPLAAGSALTEVDRWVAERLDTALAPGQLLPLPVLGIPGWADNADPAYYADPAVFRPARSAARAYSPVQHQPDRSAR